MAKVYVWSSVFSFFRPGHVSLQLDTGTYISFWPKEDNKSKYSLKRFALNQNAISPVNLIEKYEDDVCLEGYTADETIVIDRDKLNLAAIENWWRKFTSSYHLIFKNCCDVVIEALKVGGAYNWVKPSFTVLRTPNAVRQYCRRLRDA